MRVGHVLRLHSADAIFGGPTTVALNQLRELRRRGHETVLVSGWDGKVDFGDIGEVHRFRVRQGVPGAGLPGLVAPGSREALHRLLPRLDVLHVHLGRDLITMPAARIARARVPFVVQTHGMIGPDGRLRARLLDRLGVRQVLARADAVLALTPAEQEMLPAVGADPRRIHLLPNGVPVPPPAGRSPAWDGVGTPTVLFCARLHPRKRVIAFAELARELHRRRPGAVRCVVAGPDDGDLAALTDFGRRHPGVVSYLGAVEPGRVGELMRSGAVYVLPAIDEPIGMTVLESMSAGVPVVVTDSCGLAPQLAGGAGMVTDGSVAGMADAVESLLADRARYDRAVHDSFELLDRRFGIAAVTDDLEKIYTSVIDQRRFAVGSGAA